MSLVENGSNILNNSEGIYLALTSEFCLRFNFLNFIRILNWNN